MLQIVKGAEASILLEAEFNAKVPFVRTATVEMPYIAVMPPPSKPIIEFPSVFEMKKELVVP